MVITGTPTVELVDVTAATYAPGVICCSTVHVTAPLASVQGPEATGGWLSPKALLSVHSCSLAGAVTTAPPVLMENTNGRWATQDAELDVFTAWAPA
jgi:hypothetical protein